MNEPLFSDAGESRGRVVMLSGDLLFASRVKSAVIQAEMEFSFGKQLPSDSSDQVRCVLVDLSTQSRSLEPIVDQCRERFPEARLIAYGPHVQVEKLKAARQAGIETVLTNGQLDAGLGSLFR